MLKFGAVTPLPPPPPPAVEGAVGAVPPPNVFNAFPVAAMFAAIPIPVEILFKAITSVKTPNGGGGGGNIPTAPSGGGGVTAPNFNIVGNSGINQLAELGGQPIQAYVVSGEVTSAQALDRNRIQNASF